MDNLKLLRYNTGTDKQVFIKFKDDVSAVIFNATIVAYSSSAVADLVSVYKNQYIIDPQTHIFQHDIEAIQTIDKKGAPVIKKSVLQYMDQLPPGLRDQYMSKSGNLSVDDIAPYIDELVDKVYLFETEYVDKYIEKKEYDKYLKFVNLGPRPKLVVAPYFMLKDRYLNDSIDLWMQLNRKLAEKFISRNSSNYETAIQLVLEKKVLEDADISDLIKKSYEGINIDYAFVWLDDYNGFSATEKQQKNFKKILQAFNEIGIKPLMSYGGYDAILLCHSELPYRLYGVAQSVGYGETRNITPVGGGLPVNKYYFPPLHSRLNMSNVIAILQQQGFLSMDKKLAAEKFFDTICDCKQCKNIIKNNFDNFMLFNESVSFKVRGTISRNRPTTDATLIAAVHFMCSKMQEWADLETKSYNQLIDELLSAYNTYSKKDYNAIKNWCDIYEN